MAMLIFASGGKASIFAGATLGMAPATPNRTDDFRTGNNYL